MSNAAHIAVRGRRGPAVKNPTHECVVGEHLKMDLRALQDYCASLLRDAEHDLVVLCGAVVFADRTVRRRRGSGWARDIELTVPVHTPEQWSEPRIMKRLIEALEFVTGDNWRFNFVPGAERVAPGQSSIDWMEGPYVAVPFSDGLDSYLQMETDRS
jgi:hypothetical protein